MPSASQGAQDVDRRFVCVLAVAKQLSKSCRHPRLIGSYECYHKQSDCFVRGGQERGHGHFYCEQEVMKAGDREIRGGRLGCGW